MRMWSSRPDVRRFGPIGVPSENAGRVFLGVSIGNRATESNDLLGSAIGWTAGQFAKFDILIGDYVHRHNREALLDESAVVALERSMMMGAVAGNHVTEILKLDGLADVAILSCEPIVHEQGFGVRVQELVELYERSTAM